MAISATNGCRDLLLAALEATGCPLTRLRICELGNQRIKGARGFLPRVSKQALEWFGAKVTSVDINGRDGALPIDLSRPVWEQTDNTNLWQASYNLVTNFGTLEHVLADQRQAFQNVHWLCRRDGLMCHAVPCVGTRHGRRNRTWKYTADWFRYGLSRWLNYAVLKCERAVKRTLEDGTVEEYVYALFRKDDPDGADWSKWEDPPGKPG